MLWFHKKKQEKLPEDTVIDEDTGMTAGELNHILAEIFEPELQRQWEIKAERYRKIIAFLMLAAMFFTFLSAGTLNSPWNSVIWDMVVFCSVLSGILFSSLYKQTKQIIHYLNFFFILHIIETVLEVYKVLIAPKIPPIPFEVILFIKILQLLLIGTYMYKFLWELIHMAGSDDPFDDSLY